MKRYDLIVVGAGPSGLSAAICAAECGMRVAVFDENRRPGGQLFKQIHKFFGSKEHKAKVRGFRIGEELLRQADNAGVEVHLNAAVIGLYLDKEVVVQMEDGVIHYKGDAVIVATGASENAIAFEGWTLPGVIGAGAAQTMMNLHGVMPGKRVLMVGSGNVGLVVGYQLLQAGCELAALVDVTNRVGGYGVHAAKLTRSGVPFYLSHTILRAEGTDHVTGAVIVEVDRHFQPVPGTEVHLDVDTVCLAVGLSPMSQLLSMAGCTMENVPAKGGYVPVCDACGETSVKGVYATGDVSGIEEASSAMIEGRMAGYAAAHTFGFLDDARFTVTVDGLENALASLRQGMFGPGKKGKTISETDEGIPVSQSLLRNGYISDEEITRFPGVINVKGLHPVVECTQNIPCNPCQDTCPRHCIKVGKTITALPAVDETAACTACGLCVATCPGQAIFLVDSAETVTTALVVLPYEFLPMPKKGDKGMALDRRGEVICEAEVVDIRTSPAFDKTSLLTIRVPREMSMKARFYKRKGE